MEREKRAERGVGEGEGTLKKKKDDWGRGGDAREGGGGDDEREGERTGGSAKSEGPAGGEGMRCVYVGVEMELKQARQCRQGRRYALCRDSRGCSEAYNMKSVASSGVAAVPSVLIRFW